MGKFNRGANTNLVYIFCDCVFSGIAYVCALLIAAVYSRQEVKNEYLLVWVSFMLVFILANKESRLYNVTTFFYVDRIIKRVSKSFLVSASVTSTLLFYVGKATVGVVFYISFLICSYIFLLASAFFVRYYLMKRVAYTPRTLLIGKLEQFDKFKCFLEKSNFEIEIVGYVAVFDEEYDNRYIGELENLENIIRDNNIDQIYIMHRRMTGKELQPYLNICMDMGVTVRIIMDVFQGGAAQSYVSSVGTYPILTYHRVSLNNGSKTIKRIMDIFGSLIGLLLFSPIMLITAIAIKIESKGPVIFKQERVGLNGRRFFIYKFRSMCNDAEEQKETLMEQNEMEGNFMFKIQDDPRITKIGKFIRKTSIDELPQFFNVLKGDMSLVGTRPPTVDEVEMYERNHWRRISIKPGITGMWQVSGRSTITDFDEIVELDTQYIDRWNVLLDFQILIKTVLQIFFRKGAC